MPGEGLRSTLVTDGSFDRALVPILEWLLDQRGVHQRFPVQTVDKQMLPPLAGRTRPLRALIQASLVVFPCDLLFVHRDAEAAPWAERRAEIVQAIAGISSLPPTVCVVPVRMTEAWLLFNETAIRQAAANPNGRASLHLPRPSSVEQTSDPKAMLHAALRRASGKKGRDLRRFDPHEVAWQVAGLVDDYTPLRELAAFRQLEEELDNALTVNGWLADA